MCYIATIHQVGETISPQTDAAIKNMLSDKLLGNPDGGFLHWQGEGKYRSLRTMDSDQLYTSMAAMPLRHALAHFRIRTSGHTTLQNVHGWKLGNWRFVHNGFFTKLGDEGGDSDSLEYFKTIQPLVEAETEPKEVAALLEDTSRAAGMSGRFVLYNIQKDVAYYCGDWQTYVVNGEVLVISSTAVSELADGLDDHHGLFFTSEGQNEVQEGEIEGVYLLERASQPDYRFRYLKEWKMWPKPVPAAHGTGYYRERTTVGFTYPAAPSKVHAKLTKRERKAMRKQAKEMARKALDGEMVSLDDILAGKDYLNMRDEAAANPLL